MRSRRNIGHRDARQRSVRPHGCRANHRRVFQKYDRIRERRCTRPSGVTHLRHRRLHHGVECEASAHHRTQCLQIGLAGRGKVEFANDIRKCTGAIVGVCVVHRSASLIEHTTPRQRLEPRGIHSSRSRRDGDELRSWSNVAWIQRIEDHVVQRQRGGMVGIVTLQLHTATRQEVGISDRHIGELWQRRSGVRIIEGIQL